LYENSFRFGVRQAIVAISVSHAIRRRSRKEPIFSQNTFPLDEDMLERLFGEEVRAGIICHPLDITDAWKNSYSCSTNHKVWAAKFTARHPNLVALEISSFKCGHDAPIYGVVEWHYRAIWYSLLLLQGSR
jgi:predicted nucleotide-binding protein (sugar kinase/HSP70/actin superfamily)